MIFCISIKLAIALICHKVTVPSKVLVIIKGEFLQSFVFVCPLCTLVNCHAFLHRPFKKIFQKYHQSVNSLDPDQVRLLITSTCNVKIPSQWNTVLPRGYQHYKCNKQTAIHILQLKCSWISFLRHFLLLFPLPLFSIEMDQNVNS